MRNFNLLTSASRAIIVTILAGLIYGTVQQSYRSGANDPQLQMARDISERLKNNRSIDQLLTSDTVEISKSLAVFTVLYNRDGEPVQSTGLLDDKFPRVPKGVLDFTQKNGEDVLSWQPRRGVRMAMVIESVQSPAIAFVAVGRSLMEVEKRESNLVTMILFGWLACLSVILVHWVVITFRTKT